MMRNETKSCGAVVFSGDGEFLLIKHPINHGGHWDFPKGGMESGESERQTAEREIFEETGIKARFMEGFKEEIKYYPKEGVLKTVVMFLAFTIDKKVKISDEHTEYKWLKYEDAIKKMTFANSKDLLRKANEFLQNL